MAREGDMLARKEVEDGKMRYEFEVKQLSERVREILLAQPLNPFVRLEFARGQESWSTKDQDEPKCKAPAWLVERMEKLAALPPPSLEEVEISFRASEDSRRSAEQDLYVSPVMT